MHYSYLCCKHFFVETKHNSKHSPSLMTKYLAMLYHVELNVATKVPERKSLYPLLTHTKNSLPHIWNKNQVQIEITYPWCFNNLIWNSVFLVPFCLWVYIIWKEKKKKITQKMQRHFTKGKTAKLRIACRAHIIYKTLDFCWPL